MSEHLKERSEGQLCGGLGESILAEGSASAEALRPYAEIVKGLVEPTIVKTLLWP